MDLVIREHIIKAIEDTDWYHQNQNKDMVSGANSAVHQPWYKADDVYKAIKSVATLLDDIVRTLDDGTLVFTTESLDWFNRVIIEDTKMNQKEFYPNALIPCSERLPEEDGHYIVYAPTYSGGSSSSKEHHNGVMFSAFKKGKWSIEHGYHKRPNCVRAWMPLPQPWKG